LFESDQAAIASCFRPAKLMEAVSLGDGNRAAATMQEQRSARGQRGAQQLGARLKLADAKCGPDARAKRWLTRVDMIATVLKLIGD